MRSRWITIGIVRTGAYITLRQWGCPGGFVLFLRGRSASWMPCEFLHWEDVLRAVCRRLQLARLELRAIACEVAREWRGAGGCCNPEGSWDVTLRAEVRRARGAGLRFAAPLTAMEEVYE